MTTFVDGAILTAAQLNALTQASDLAAASGSLLVGWASGTTANRVTPLNVGQPYFDTTLSQPIWASQITPSIIWVNSAGVQV